jgi:ABC-type lipoprotein release transport system permease subunit
MAAGNLRRNLLRSFLTISGVVIGIGTIVFLVSLGFGLQQLAIEKVANLDALTLLTVNPSNKEGTLLDKSAADKFSKIKNVIEVSPLLSFPAQIEKTGMENTGGTVFSPMDHLHEEVLASIDELRSMVASSCPSGRGDTLRLREIQCYIELSMLYAEHLHRS